MAKKEKTKVKKKRKIIKPKIQTGFCIISLLFILGCCIFYGSRLIKYYRVYNPKSSSGETLKNLASTITTSSPIVCEGDGLYSSSGSYIYKGENVNNYVIVSNMIFRIIRINVDKTMDIVLDEYINKLNWDSELKNYQDSYVNEYLNAKFVDILDKNILEKTRVCDEVVLSADKVTCDKPNTDNYVRLLGVSDFLNSIVDGKTYLVNKSENLWLYNHNEKEVWHTTGATISLSEPNTNYGVKPVVTLKNTTILVNGDGTKENPYQITTDKNKIGVGTYLDIADDVYIVYEIGDDYYKVESNKLLKNTMIFDSSTNEYKNSSLKEYLESTYLDSLSYKNILTDASFGTLISKVGLLSREDLKFNSSLESYYLSDVKDSNVYLYNASLVSSRPYVRRGIRPCLGIKKDLKIISGNGTKLAPFIVEV